MKEPSNAMQNQKCETLKTRRPLKGKRIALQDSTSKIDRHSRARSIQINIGVRSSQLTDLVPMNISDGAVDILRVRDELRAGREDLDWDTDRGAGEGVVEVDLGAVEGRDDWGVSAALVVDEGDGCCSWCRGALGSWQSEGSGREEGGDGGDGELHVDDFGGRGGLLVVVL
jgi:hypothetical protein